MKRKITIKKKHIEKVKGIELTPEQMEAIKKLDDLSLKAYKVSTPGIILCTIRTAVSGDYPGILDAAFLPSDLAIRINDLIDEWRAENAE